MARFLLLSLLLLAPPAAHAQTDPFPDLWTTDFAVSGLAVRGDTLFVGGDFAYVGPPTGQLAVIDKTTAEGDASFPRVGGTLAGVTAVVLDGSGGYYAGGAFEHVSGEPRRNLARVRPDGTLDPAFQPDPRVTGSSDYFGAVSALALDRTAASPSGAGVLYVGGTFDTVGGQARTSLAALDAATGAVLPLAAGFSYSDLNFRPRVETILLHGGVLYVGGSFDAVGGQARTSLAALDATSGALLPWAPTLTVGPPSVFPFVFDLVLGDSTLYVRGDFDAAAGLPRRDLAEVRLAGDGGGVTPWAPAGTVSQPLVLGGSLWGVSATDAAGFGSLLGRLDRTTGALTRYTLAPELSSGRALALDPVGGASGQGTLYLAASRAYGPGFTDRAPVVVALDPATATLTGFEARGGGGPTELDARVLAVEPGPTGRLFVGGYSASFGGVRRGGLVALSLTTGRLLPGFDGQGFPAEDLALSPDGRYLYALNETFGASVKEFDLVTGAVRDFPTAAPPPPPSPRPPGPTRVVQGSALAVTADRVYAVAPSPRAYDRATGAQVWTTSARLYFARNNGDVVLLDGPGGPGGDEGTLYVAGPFFEVAGAPRDGFAAFAARSGQVLPWDVQAGNGRAEGYSAAWLDVDGDGPAGPSLYLGGDSFQAVQGQPRASAFAVAPATGTLQPWAPAIGFGQASSLASHRRGDGPGGVVYGPKSEAYDAETGARLAWDPALLGSALVLVASPRHNAVFAGGAFYNSLRGSGHANLVAVTPAAPFLPVSGEAGAPGGGVPASATIAVAGANPARSSSALALSLPASGPVSVSLYDVLGRRVAVLHDGPLAAGVSRLAVDASALPAGVYVARVVGDAFAASATLTVVH